MSPIESLMAIILLASPGPSALTYQVSPMVDDAGPIVIYSECGNQEFRPWAPVTSVEDCVEFVVYEDGSAVTNPSLGQVKEKLGL